MSFTTRRLHEQEHTPRDRRSIFASAGLILLRASGPLLHLGHLWRERQEERRQQEKRVNILKRIIVILVVVFCAALLFAGTARALIALKLLSLQQIVDIAGSELPADKHGHTNVLLVGQGDSAHEGVDLTDTIMIASIDPEKTKSTVMLSLPRDLYFLETEKMGEGRINSLYRDYKLYLRGEGLEEAAASQEAMKELAKEIGLALDMEMHGVIKVDFIGFVQAVDAIEGIDIVVPEKLVDTEYPGPDYTYETFEIEAGPQHIDGETALKYARSRHSTSDFDRSKRQQQIIKAIGEKMKQEGLLSRPSRIMELVNILQEHVETTFDLRTLVSLAGAGKELDQEKINSMQLNTGNGLYGGLSEQGGLLYSPPRDQFEGASVLLPVSIPEDPVTWDRLRLLADILIHERLHAGKTPIRILNAGAEPGSAKRLGGELIRFGFNVVTMENAEDDREAESSVLKGEETSAVAKKLSQLLGMRLETLPALPQSSSAAVEMPPQAITIELGTDYEYAALQLPLTE